ncbi:deoxyribonuclease IV [Virgibacillus sp. SK37]|uniref:deoxyribonuclease IV n=1 Tax=Virgibacillus sp. SK37 TaxID=403957 RepID=UPI0004D1D441|nr:deoxyribonuclease IV [Virgibacillus sp. SK37]AIF43066.1 endonuclease IV [Virgibacillus sp. SK37]
MKFGCHVSIKDGYTEAAKIAKSYGAAAFQFFPKNPRSLSVKDINLDDASMCRDFCLENSLESVAHTPYPTSLTPRDTEKHNKVITSLLNDLEIAEACGTKGIVVHFGKQLKANDPLPSYHLMIDMLNEVLSRWQGDAKILLENSAGLPGTMGTTMEELAMVRKLSDYPDKIGFCLDTCHAFASGLWTGNNWEEVVDKAEELQFFEQLEVIHFNNSKYETGLGKDRHANILSGGFITEKQFEEFIQTPQLREIPFILETPKDTISHKEEIQQLQKKWGHL